MVGMPFHTEENRTSHRVRVHWCNRGMCSVLGSILPNIRMKLFLIDDGTLDSVFQCEKCGMIERYDSETLGRSENEDMEAILEIVSEDHAEECSLGEA